MRKLLIAIAGIALLFFALQLKNNIKQGEATAVSKDKTQRGYGMITGEDPPCKWDPRPPERVINQSKSQAVVVKTANPLNKKCLTVVSLRAPDFILKPVKEDQQIVLPPKTNGSIAWIISPRSTGTFDITVTDDINTKIYGITVKNMFGLTAEQGKILSSLGTVFGPMFTIPWWLDWWKKQKQDKTSNTAKSSESAH